MNTLKLMADYHCYPLWDAAAGEVGNIDPHTLAISPDLKSRLIAWSVKFDATLNMEAPLNSGFSSAQEAEDFKKEGRALVEQLQSELGDQCHVIYKE